MKVSQKFRLPSFLNFLRSGKRDGEFEPNAPHVQNNELQRPLNHQTAKSCNHAFLSCCDLPKQPVRCFLFQTAILCKAKPLRSCSTLPASKGCRGILPVTVTKGDGQGVGHVAWFRHFGETQQRCDHPLNLFL